MQAHSTIKTKSRIEVPRIQKGKLNIYSPEQIMSFGSVQKFLDHATLKEPIQIPDFGFSENEWNEMEKMM